MGRVTNKVGNLKGICQIYLAAVKYCVCRGRLFAFAFRATTGERGFALAIVGMAAFSAYKTINPFFIGQEFKAFFLTRKHILKLDDRNILKKIFHFIICHDDIGTIFECEDTKK
jgi:hypothetical protein